MGAEESSLARAAASASHALVVKPGSLGDVVHTLPAVAALYRAHPHLQVRWVIDPRWSPLLKGNPHLAAERPFLHFPRRAMRGLKAPARIREFVRELRALPKPDLVLDFQGLLRSGLIARASGAKIRAGLSDSREGARHFHTHIVEAGPGAHAIDRTLALVRAFGAETGTVEWPLPGDDLPSPISRLRNFILIHPYSRGAGKALSGVQVNDLCTRLHGHCIVLVGHPDTPPKNLPENVTDLTGKTTLPQLVTLARRSTLTISSDSGPMHIAAAVAPKILSIHTWTDPRMVGPYREDALLWKAGRIARLSGFTAQELTTVRTLDDTAISQIADASKEHLANRGDGRKTR